MVIHSILRINDQTLIKLDNSSNNARIRGDVPMDPLKPSPREIIDRQIKQCLETGNRQELANILDDEVVTKRLEAARYSEAIARKALDVLCDAIAGDKISSNTMLLRIVVTLSKLSSTFLTEVNEYQRQQGLHLGK